MTPGTQMLLNSVGMLILSSILTFVAARYWFQRNQAVAEANRVAQSHSALQARVAELETKLQLVNQAIVPISTAFQAILIKELTHFHTPEMDKLLEKIGPPNTMTLEEQDRLEILLEERTRDMGPLITPSERDAARMLPLVMRRAILEADVLTAAETLRLALITVAAVVGIPKQEVVGAEAAEVVKTEARSIAVEGPTQPNTNVLVGLETAHAETDVVLLEKIEKHTAKSADALATITAGAAAKLAAAARDKSKDEPQ